MKVLFLNDNFGVRGGADRAAWESAAALTEAGVDVSFLAASDGGEPAGVKLSGSSASLGVPDFWQLSRLRALREGLNRDSLKSQLKKALAAFPAEATWVHVHAVTRAWSPAVLKWLVDWGYRVVLTCHDYFWFCPNGQFYVEGEAGVCVRTPLGFSCLRCGCEHRGRMVKFWRAARTRQMREALAGVRGVAFPSRTALELCQPYLNSTPTAVIHHSVAVEREGRVRAEENRDYIFAGRLTPEKGVRMIAEWARDSRRHVRFIGEGPEAEALRNYGEFCNVTGWLPPDEVKHEMLTARALLFPVHWPETFGLVVAEALAMGLPVVVSGIAGAAERVDHGETGWVLPETDKKSSFGQAMKHLEESRLVEQMSREAYRRYWEEPMSRSAHAKSLLQWYQSLA